ncbi:hypothetical protein BDW22DRAFT_1348505 [Trametopsis cervina]|nr:hypothetical protein BDW22DRAFT_1348505 [Trametopsis cervina]
MPMFHGYTTDEDSDNDALSDNASNDSDDDYRVNEDDILPMSYDDQVAMDEAIQNLEACDELFKSWYNELKRTESSRNLSELEQSLKDLIRQLKSQSSKALDATKLVLRSHRQFARLFYQALDSASQTGSLEFNWKIEALTETIRNEACRVTTKVSTMQETLDSVAELLSDNATERSKRRSLGEKVKANVVQWTRKACSAVSHLLGIGAALANMLFQPHIGAGLNATAGLIKKLEKALDGTLNDKQLGTLINFIRVTLPDEVDRAKECLQQLEGCGNILRRHLKTSNEKEFAIDRAVAAKMSKRWRQRYSQLKSRTDG